MNSARVPNLYIYMYTAILYGATQHSSRANTLSTAAPHGIFRQGLFTLQARPGD